ncbi:MAG: glycosyltransferase family 39 protein [Flavobacteriales bacterium]|jgi:hypothetical protein|nr:glycosyltransferase family 39 protein [Flavobacteriales bacterium]
MKVLLKNGLLILLFTYISILLHRGEINDFPKHIHAWAQSDYYALSLGFIDNGLDFFHPQNFVQNPQFPDYFQTPKENGITAADFPIHTYNVALLMRLFDSEAPWIFRSYTLFFSIVGMLFLFLLIKALNGSDIKALFGVALLLLSPVYLYYRAGFLPSIPALSFVIIAYYYYLLYLKKGQYQSFYIAITFFTLATLTRTPFAIFLIATFCQEGLNVLKKRKMNYTILASYLISFSFIIGYFIYNNYLRSLYGSIFLSKPLTPDSWEVAKHLFYSALENWKWHYLTKWHYLFLPVSLILGVIQLIRTKTISPLHQQLLLQFVIVLTGVLMYSFLMLKQFKAHDYYFIDTFFTPFILYTVIILTYIKFDRFYFNLIAAGLLVYATKAMTDHTLDAQIQRKETGSWDKTLAVINSYSGGDQLLHQLNIPKDAKLLVLDSEAPNIPFILLRRYGYSVHFLTQDNIIKKMDWNYDYIVMQDHIAQHIVNSIFPELSHYIQRIGGNGAFSVYQKLATPAPKSIDQLLQIDQQQPFYQNTIKRDSIWRNKDFNADSLIVIDQHEEFGLTLERYNLEQLTAKNCLIKINLDIRSDALKSANLIFAISNENETFTYQDRKVQTGNHSYLFTSQPVASPNHKVSLYIWNGGKEKILVKDFKVTMY